MKTVKNNLIYIFTTIVILTIALSCDESYRLHNMVDDQLYALKHGLTSEDMFNWDNYTYEYFVIKSGAGQQKAEVEILIDENLINDYNIENGTSYQAIPGEHYKINVSKIVFEADEYRKSFPIIINTDAIRELQKSTGETYVLPIRVRSLNSLVEFADAERATSLIIPNIKDPYIQFERNYSLTNPAELRRLGVSLDRSSIDEFQFFTEVSVNYPNTTGVTFSAEVDPVLIADYNTLNGTSFALLPESAYSIDKSNMKITPNLSYQPFEIKILKAGLYQGDTPMYGEYILPIRINSVSNHGINPDQSVLLLTVVFNPEALDRSGWEIIDWNSSISEEPQYAGLGRTPEKMLDGDVATFWGSKWDAPKPLPYYFIFDMKKDYKIFKIGFTKPNEAWRGNLKNGYFEISSDNVTWRKLSDWSVESNDPRSHEFSQDGSTARYIKFVISDSFGYANMNIGPESGARCDISEFNVWGE